MVVLTEQIEIPASYEKMEAWTANFEEEFVKWSPYHIECNLYNGNYHAGSKQRCTRGYKQYKETSGLIEWKECQIFHSIFT